MAADRSSGHREGAGAAFVEAMQAGEPFHAEYRVLSPDGVVRWVLDRTVVLPRVDGQPALTQGMIFDITERKRAEEELGHRANHDPLTGPPTATSSEPRLTRRSSRRAPTSVLWP